MCLIRCLLMLLIWGYVPWLPEHMVTNTIQERSNSDFDVKCATIQFYGNSYNTQFDHWIELKLSPNMLSYLGLKFQINQSLGRYRNTGQQRLYKFCYLLLFDLWTSSNDTIQERSNSDFDVKCATIQFYGNSHNSQSDCWIELKFYVESPNMLSYLGLEF